MEKYIAYLLVFIISLNYNLVNAQEKLKEGKAIFKSVYPDADNVSERMLSVLGSGHEVYFKNGKTRVEYDDKNSTIIIIDPKTKERISLNYKNENKLAVKISREEKEKDMKREFGDYHVKITDETKIIAGFKCKKALVSYKPWNKDIRTMEIWFTKDVSACSPKYPFKEIDGFIMETAYDDILYPQGQAMDFMEITTCEKIEKELVSDDMFKIPDDFKVETREELSKHVNVQYH